MDERAERNAEAQRSFVLVVCLCALAALSFVLAMATFPGGGYNPAYMMLSMLGRAEVRLVEYPWCHHFFVAGLALSALSVAFAASRVGLSRCGAALNIVGLACISIASEDVSMVLHNAGCWLAAAGGAVLLLVWRRKEVSRRVRRAWTVSLVLPILLLGLALAANAFGILPFAPFVPTVQKVVILSFAAWLIFLSARGAGRRARLVGVLILLVTVVVAAFLFLRPDGPSVEEILESAPKSVERPNPLPMSADELAAHAWLEHVTGALSTSEEREWWDIGGPQHGIFSKRDSVAFAGGFYWLDLDCEWRIGASAMRIISLAESNGSSFRQP